MSSVDCVRCKRHQSPPEQVPHPGELGAEIRAKVCGLCWAEWEAMEVMVINELRLNFMDPNSADILTRHMREFLCLDPGSATLE